MIFKKNQRRERAAIGTGSVADIAFLLLIFFLVATTIDSDKGIQAKLPPFVEEEPDVCFRVSERNLLRILVNAEDELLVEGKQDKISNLKERTKEFILNPSNNDDLAQSPVNAIISLQNDRGTSYDAYLQVYNELRAAYNEIWKEIAMERYGKSYDDLDFEFKKNIRADFPLIISEAEPTDFAEK
ncbi:MAG: ExbD/TolR family protein [Saprospiraceae bacterium]